MIDFIYLILFDLIIFGILISFDVVSYELVLSCFVLSFLLFYYASNCACHSLVPRMVAFPDANPWRAAKYSEVTAL